MVYLLCYSAQTSLIQVPVQRAALLLRNQFSSKTIHKIWMRYGISITLQCKDFTDPSTVPVRKAGPLKCLHVFQVDGGHSSDACVSSAVQQLQL